MEKVYIPLDSYKYNMEAKKPKIGLCVSTYERRDGLEACLNTLFKTTNAIPNKYYLVVDDNSNDGTRDFLKSFKDFHPDLNLRLKNKNLGYVDSFNLSLELASRADCDVFFLINDDILFKKPGWVELYLDAIQKSGIKHFNFMDGRNIAGRKEINGITVSYHTWVRGCLEVMTREVYDAIGGYDLRFHGLGCMDTEFSDRAILGGFTDRILEELLRNNLVSYGNKIMGFCADVDRSREFIHDPHPNIGVSNPQSTFGSRKGAAVATLNRNRLKQGLYKRDNSTNLTVLLYHQINGDEGVIDPVVEATSQENFREHICVMKALGYEFIRTDDLSHSKKLPDKPALITFDDGYRNNLNARPVLKDEKVSAMLFLTTGYIGSTEIKGYDLLVHLLQERPFNEVIELYQKIAAKNKIEIIPDERQVQNNSAFRFHFRSCLSLEQQKRIANHLSMEMGFEIKPEFAQSLYLSWQDINEMSDCFDFGVHTVSHTLLSEVSDEQLKFEIGESKRVLEQRIGRMDWFAYPYGYPNSYNQRVIDILKSCSFKGAFTTLPSQNRFPIEKMYEIGRFSMSDETAKDLVEYAGLHV